MKVVFTGKESSGKTLLMFRLAQKYVKRNKRWLRIRSRMKLSVVPRTFAFNQPISDSFRDEILSSGSKLIYFRSFAEIEDLMDADIFIDELLKFFPSRGSDPLPPNVMDFLSQGAKNGNHIVGSSQDFSQVHKQFRLLVNKVYVIKKIVGSPRPMRSSPPVNFIWGIGIKFSVKPDSFKGDNTEMKTNFIPIPFFISKKDTLRYSTLYRIPHTELPLVRLRPQKVQTIDFDGTVLKETLRYR